VNVTTSGGNLRIRTELLLLVAFCGFLFFYGLGAFGLLGADEPRYAQIAREMMDRSDWVTPTLHGKPWLEKPPLYYWEAILTYRAARAALREAVTEQTARFPGAVDATIMVVAIYFFLRRFRPGSELDGALITASCAGVIGFAHAAATDMPLAATFTIALLSWYDWYERRQRAALATFFLFLALGMLAKGPVAPALAAVIVLFFAALKRQWNVASRSLWPPGILLFLIVALPWYVIVQMRNPQFFRFFILEHNLARFSSNVYHHPQPFWFYLPVFLPALMPWTVWLIAALVERGRSIRQEGREAFSSPEDSWALFLLVWTIVPVLFFSASQSKLPGYILPAVPAAALLVANYLAERQQKEIGISWPLAVAHGVLCGGLAFGALSAGSIAISHHLVAGKEMYVSLAIGTVLALGIGVALVTKGGAGWVRPATMVAVIAGVAAVIRFAAPAIDTAESARPIAATIQVFSHEPVPVALYHVNRNTEYGLEFYLNRGVQKYEDGPAPATSHLLVAASGSGSELRNVLAGRKMSYLISVPEQKLDLYWIGQ